MLNTLTPEQIAAYKEAGVLDKIVERAKNDVTANLPFARPVYAPRTGEPNVGGIFTQPGVRPDMWSTLNQPMDITALLRPRASVYAQERIGILTGQTATVGTNPDDTCGDPVRPGQLKTCQQNYIWGEFFIGSDQIKISDAGMIGNRAVTERQILNTAPTNAFLPDALGNPNVDFMSIEAQQLYQLGTAMRRAVAKVMINGNPATAAAAAEPGFVKEHLGLDNIIKTGYSDAVTGDACPAADSIVVNWNADLDSQVNGRYLAQYMTDVYFGRVALAMQLGIDATWAWVMPFPLFRELTYSYANRYYDTRSSGVVGNPYQTQQERVRALQLEMLNGYYIPVDGVPVPVLFSDGITISAGGGNYQQADMFLLNTSANGRDALQYEFFPMNNPFATRLASRFTNEIQFLNNGMYILYAERSRGCMELSFEGKMRMWHDLPFLCAKFQNLKYVSNISYRSPYTDGTNYQNGGVTLYEGLNA